YTLRRAVDDEQLWQDLDGARRTGPLTPGRRAALALMVGLDYGPLLDVAGYRPPPPAALLSADLNQAASELLTVGATAPSAGVAERARAAARAVAGALKIFNCGGYESVRSGPVLARKPSMRPGRYCIRLSRVLISAVS